MDGDVDEPMSDEPDSRDAAAKETRGKKARNQTPVPGAVASLISGDTSIEWMDFFGRVNMHASKNQLMGLPKTTELVIHAEGFEYQYRMAYRTLPNIDECWRWSMDNIKQHVHSKLNALKLAGEYDEDEERVHGEVCVWFY